MMHRNTIQDLRPPSSRTGYRAALIAVALVGTTAGAGWAQEPAKPAPYIFELNNELFVERAGQRLEQTKTYHSQSTGTVLILGPELNEPLLLNPHTKAIETFPAAKLVKRSEEEYHLPSEVPREARSDYRIEGTQVIFQVDEQQIRLKLRPPLLGSHEAEDLKQLRPEYRRTAAEYTPAPEALEVLRTQPSASVRVVTYFGTWCPICTRLMPRLMRVADELGESEIQFVYYGLPPPPEIEKDPAAQREQIRSLPTTIVYVGEEEVGRLGITELQEPELALQQLLPGSD